MGLTNKSVGKNVLDKDLEIDKANQTVIAIAGNPNVGKSTIFNALTGLNQHTGNWAGKTVSNAQGVCKYKDKNYILVDIPGTYSLLAHSKEEEIARNFICFGNADITLIVCDGTCLERNLNLVLQAMEISPKVFICINLMDEAERKGIEIDTEKLSQLLNVPVIKTQADKPETFRNLMEEIANYSTVKKENIFSIPYPLAIEEAIKPVLKSLLPFTKNTNINNRWLSLRFLDNDIDLIKETSNYINYDLLNNKEIQNGIKNGIEILEQNGINNNILKDKIVSTIIQQGENISQQIVSLKASKYSQIDRKIDKIITGKILGYPLMFLTLALIFWITIVGANYPSKILSNLFFYIEEQLILFATFIGVTPWVSNMVFSGMFRVLGWVVAVMLPPMAIFFPLFTLLEDLGYLPRVAFNLDKHFQRCCACGKQALTMCMVFIILQKYIRI